MARPLKGKTSTSKSFLFSSQIFTGFREQLNHICFASFVSFGLVGTAALVYSIQKYNNLQTLQSYFNIKLPLVEKYIFEERKETERINMILELT